MNFRVTRRAGLLGAAALICARDGAAKDPARGERFDGATGSLVTLENREGGRLGVAVLDTGTGKRLEHREGELFAMCSTFKFIAAAAILQRVDQRRERLDRWVNYQGSDLLEYAPVSKEHSKEHRMTLADVCSAAVEWSDNTAANLMLQILDGPAGVTRFIRTMGDNVTRLDRNEPALNVVGPGDVRDTSSPDAMIKLLSTLLFGQVLSAESRTRLATWMAESKVGGHRIRAGLPAEWRLAHKTGTGSDATNDVGLIWPPNRAPLVFAAFYAQGSTPQEQREAVLRDVGRSIAAGFDGG
jgi:beta-lactamase class A